MSYRVELEKVLKIIRVTKVTRLYVNLPRLTIEEEDFLDSLKSFGMSVLLVEDTPKSLEKTKKQIEKREEQRIAVVGWITESAKISQLFVDIPFNDFTYCFIYPNNLKKYSERLIENKALPEKAREEALNVKNIYQSHLMDYDDVILTALV